MFDDDLEALALEEAKLREEAAEITRMERELANRKLAASTERENIHLARLALYRQKRADDARREEEARIAQLEALNNQRQIEIVALSEELDKRTENAKWRSRAMQHQIDGAKFLATAKRAICADGMGVGKTLQSLMYLDMVGSKRALIICQGDVMGNFVDEMKRFTDRPIALIGKLPKATQTILIDTYNKTVPEFVMVVNYETWFKNRAILDQLIDVRFDTVIVDEAHIIKETDKAPYFGVSKIVEAENECPNCHGAALVINRSKYYYCEKCEWSSDFLSGHHKKYAHTERRSIRNLLTMTGTPILNRPDEIYSLLSLIDGNLFPSKAEFIRNFCQYDYEGKLEWKAGGESMLAKKISAMFIRRTHETAGIKLPPQGIIIHEIEFDAEAYPLQAECMKKLRENAQLMISENKALTVPDLLSLILRERQAAVWPGGIKMWEQATELVDLGDGETYESPLWDYDNCYANGEPRPVKNWYNVGEAYKESQKIDKAVELIKQLNDDGRRVVVFSQFKTALEELHDRLGHKSVRFDGDTGGSDRDIIKSNFNREFNETPKWDNILCNYKTGGVGLNLTAATAVVVLDYEWNQGKLDQAYARINRIGQTEETQVHILKLMGTMDEWMDNLVMKKQGVTGAFDKAMVDSDDFKNSFATELRKLLGE